MLKPLWTLLCLICVLSFSLASQAAQVAKVKGRALLIDTQGDSLRAGDILYVVDMSGKKKAIIKIMKVRGNKAIAKLGKGKPQAGMALLKRGASFAPPVASSSDSDYSTSNYSSGDFGRSWGGMLGLGSDSLTADIITDTGIKQGTASTSGMGYSLNGLYDHRLMDHVWFRGLAGIETLKSEGGSNCGDSGTEKCTVNLMYLGASALGRYLFSEGKFSPWVGGGVSLLFPLTKDSSLLKSSSVTSTYVLLFSGGLDWKISPRMSIPLSLEYGMFPKSETVEASWIQFRVGVAMPL